MKRFSQSEVEYTPVSTTGGEACAGCRFYGGAGYCHIVEPGPLDIEPTGYCNRYEAMPEPEVIEAEDVVEVVAEVVADILSEDVVDDAPVAEDEVAYASAGKGIVGTIKGVVDKVKTALKPRPQFTSFKVVGNKWIAVYSNNFLDRDGEIFTQKAIDDYITRVDAGIVPKPELWFWHTPSARLGQTKRIARSGHFVIAWGEFDNTPMAQKARAHFEKKGRGYANSHGFEYSPSFFDGKHYHQFNTFEISVLPHNVAANPFTSFAAVKEFLTMEDKAKYEEFVSLFGKSMADEILEATARTGKSLSDFGVAYKDFSHAKAEDMSEDDEEKKEDDEEVEEKSLASKALKALIVDVVGSQSEVTKAATEAVKLATEALKEIRELRAEFALRPAASQSARTIVDGDAHKEALDALQKRQGEPEGDPFFMGAHVDKSKVRKVGEKYG